MVYRERSATTDAALSATQEVNIRGQNLMKAKREVFSHFIWQLLFFSGNVDETKIQKFEWKAKKKKRTTQKSVRK